MNLFNCATKPGLRKITQALVVSAALFSNAWAAESIVIPTSVTLAPDSGPVRFGNALALTDGSGLTGGVAYLNGDPIPANWNTVDLHGSGAGDDWLTVITKNGDKLAVEFTLQDYVNLNGVVLWNYNASGGWTSRGVNSLSIYISTDGGSNWFLAETIAPEDALGQATEAAQEFRFSGAYRANAIKIVGNAASGTNAAIDEILFLQDDSVVAAPRDKIIVPASVALSPESAPIRNGAVEAIIDGSGLTGGVPYTDGDPVPGSWDTVNKHGSGSGTKWVEVYRKVDNVLTEGLVAEFALNDLRNVGGMVLWNYNAGGGMAKRGVDSVDIYTSDDAGANWTFAETLLPVDANGSTPDPAQQLEFVNGPYLANAMKIVGKSTSDNHALDELLFIEDTSIKVHATRPTPINRNSTFVTTSNLTWTAPEEARIAVIDNYDVYLGTNPNITENPVQTVTNANLPVTLSEGENYYWRVDTRVTRTDGTQELLEGELWEFRTLPAHTTLNLDPDPSWFVGNTTAGEWLEFQDVFFAEGGYRFTGHFGAIQPGKRVSLSIGGQTLGTVEVPATTSYENFELVHLGHTVLAEGHYDVRLTFETGDVSADMVYVRKSVDTTASVVDDDIASPLPSTVDGTAVSPIFSNGGEKKYPFCKDGYSTEQCQAWYKQAIYTTMLSDDNLYAKIDEHVASRLDFGWLHGKFTKDTDDWGYDRDYVPENGDSSANKNKRMFEVLAQHPYADFIKFGYFVDNLVYGKTYENNTGLLAEWGAPDFQQWIWDNWTKPWFDTVPADKLYLKDGHVYINFWTANCFACKDKPGISDFMIDLKARIKAEYGYDTRIIVAKSFVDKDPDVLPHVYARQNWFTWYNDVNVTHSKLNGVTSSFATNGRKLPITTIWESDWDPVSNTGTRKNLQYDDDGNYVSTHTNGVADYRAGLAYADSIGSEWMLLEAWGNKQEGTAWFRTDHQDNYYLNEFINITREFADKATSAILLQAEAADHYYDSTPGNAGKAYRYHWHAGSDTDLDIFRPRRKIHGFAVHPNPPSNLVQIAGGNTDIWGLDNSGLPYATEMDGNEIWNSATRNDLVFDQIELGKSAWGIVGSDVYRAGLSTGFKPWTSGTWKVIATGVNFTQLSLNIMPKQVWAVDANGDVWKGHQDDGNFAQVTGVTLTDIAAGEYFVWGIDTQGNLVQRDIQQSTAWQTMPNPLGFVELKAGSGEIWGLTVTGALYRNSESGAGIWELVASNVQSFAPAREFIWLLKVDGSVEWSKISGFEETINPDIDGDGVLNAADACPTQMVSGNIMIQGRDTGIADRVDASGCSLSNQIVANFETAALSGSKPQMLGALLPQLQVMVRAREITMQEWFQLRVSALLYALPLKNKPNANAR